MNVEMTSEPDRFRTLYDANHDRVHRLLGRIAGPLDAEDLTQIVFAKAATALPRFRGDALASTWLYRIAANVASDCLRGRAAREAKLTVRLPEGRETGQAHATSPFLTRKRRRSSGWSAKRCMTTFVARSDNIRRATRRCSFLASWAASPTRKWLRPSELA